MRGARIFSPAAPDATALLMDDGVISWLGADADAPAADKTMDLDGALVTPAFVDAHVHVTDTGVTMQGLDLAATRSRADVLDRLARHAAGQAPDAVVLGHGWDESRWPDPTPPRPAELDRAAAGRRVYLSRADVHSCVVSTALLAAANPATPGHDPGGWLTRDAHHEVRAVALGSLGPTQRRDAQRHALKQAARAGVAAVHECGGPEISSEDDFTGLLALAGPDSAGTERLPEVYGYWGELGAAKKARDLGALGAAGDLFADGALGSRTAHLREPYTDEPDRCGHGYVTANQVAAHLVECTENELQGGFHAIGDAALATVVAGFALAAGKVGLDRLRARRHRVEHVEMVDKRLIGGLVEFGVIASVQPVFDWRWGGTDRMYATRLGVDRALAANPFGSMAGVGVTLAFGSDSPVTPVDPWSAVYAAVFHRNPTQRLSVRQAFAAHTRGGWRAVHRDAEGVLAPGAPATLAAWDWNGDLLRGLPVFSDDPDAPTHDKPRCRLTVLRGTPIHWTST
ncbi:amidohydrolase [Virgisporangium aurantiacum]|uniref:Amidohydrolase n=1 Tax=Virgisporangium aurantiacum TaxID=175570 RepID=A0A8J3Z7C7_9ACTN|nr:amidohydrolase [Virgisporangium aurantiacum]